MPSNYWVNGVKADDLDARWWVREEIYTPPTGTLVSAAATPGTFWSQGMNMVGGQAATLWQAYTIRDIWAFRRWLESLPYAAWLEVRPAKESNKPATRCLFKVLSVSDPIKNGDGVVQVGVTWEAIGVWEDTVLNETEFRWLPGFTGSHFPAKDVSFSVPFPRDWVEISCAVTGSWVRGIIPNGTTGDHVLLDPTHMCMKRGTDWFAKTGVDMDDGLFVDPRGFRLIPNAEGKFNLVSKGYKDTANPKIRFRRTYAQPVFA